MTTTATALLPPNHRILVVDDNPAIHEDMRKVLQATTSDASSLREKEAQLFGAAAPGVHVSEFEITFALQGQEALVKVEAAQAAGIPFALAFVDIRMPPGWDGIETVQHLWRVDPGLQIVICTAYSDYSWEDMAHSLGESDSLLILKKPFDNIEVLQLAHALTRKWALNREAKLKRQELDGLVRERTIELAAANGQLAWELEQRKKMEQALVQAQRLESVGHLAGGLAHEFNNLHTIVQGFAGLCLDTVGAGQESLRSYLGEILSASRRAGRLTSDLMAFSRQQFIRPKRVECNVLLQQLHPGLQVLLTPRIRLHLELTENLPAIVADRSAIERVLTNLLTHARDTMPEAGDVTLRTRVAAGNAAAPVTAANSGQEYVCLEVSDSNPVSSVVPVDRLFDPFYSTKGPGQVGGLGLASAYGLVRQHEGWIEVDVEPGRGTTFRTFWPKETSPSQPTS